MRTSQSTLRRAPRRPPASLDRLDRADAAVGHGAAAGRDEHVRAAGVDGRGDQLAGAGARGRLGVALVRGDEREAAGRATSTSAVLPSPSSAKSAVTRPSERIAGRGLEDLAAEAREQHLQRALAAVGDGAEVGAQPGAL